MTEADTISQTLDLVDYRRRVAEIYSDVRRQGPDADSWRSWASSRTELLRTHSQSPLDEHHRSSPDTVRYFGYDPSWQVVGTVHPVEPGSTVPAVSEERSTFAPIGTVTFERAGIEHRLGLFWLQGYGGGLFLPFRDETNGISTYGAGRYLLDGAKSADLGSAGAGQLLLDFNFAYHPSCVWDPIWPCPLAPPSNHLAVEVEAGERKPELPSASGQGEYRCERCGSLTHDGDGHDCC